MSSSLFKIVTYKFTRLQIMYIFNIYMYNRKGHRHEVNESMDSYQ